MFKLPAYRKAQDAAERGHKFKAPTCNVVFIMRSNSDAIYIRVSVNGVRSTNKSTGIKAAREDFDTKTRTILNDPTNTVRLRKMESAVYEVFKDREITGRSLEPNLIRDIAFGLRGHDEQEPTVIEAISLYQQWHEQRFGSNDVSIGTIRRYRTYKTLLTTFFTLTPGYGKDTRFNQLKPALQFHLVDTYLKAQKKYCHNYALKIFQFFRGLVEYAIAHEWADRNPLRHARIRKYVKAPVTLSMEDLAKLKAFEFVEPHANQVRDVFLLCCYTGLAYSDVAELSSADLANINDVACILKNRTKSGVQAFVPLFPDAREILDKYRFHEGCRMSGKLVPVLSNPKMNKWLKIIGNTVGIKESLHTHLARKTFTMYSEELGFTLSEMAVMLGHTNATMTENHYYKRRREPVIVRFKEIFKNEQKQAS
ncbi:site-specific integrase [Spirosoma rhododendri]|uniref:Site-specific integrase n=1 Tax=Spirosoma rhododendri TaxID=2728024 RepID=A0A7L5DMF4_9BACT|nr:site-specific integrase [Spirosoma rhododendri]QJD79586.1 site-specific integrase [Spirosoma rhododendri]